MAQDNRDFVNQFANEGGGSILCEDKRLSELASANEAVSIDVAESSPTEFVPLQDLDGNLIKISPASFQNALKNLLGKLLVANDKDGASSVRIPAISGSGANADFGSNSLAALASLLGENIPLNDGYYDASSADIYISHSLERFGYCKGLITVSGPWAGHSNGAHIIAVASDYMNTGLKISGLFIEYATPQFMGFTCLMSNDGIVSGLKTKTL